MPSKLTLIHPGGVLLADFLEPFALSHYRLARDISVAPRRINEIVHGTRAITADTALRLGRYYGASGAHRRGGRGGQGTGARGEPEGVGASGQGVALMPVGVSWWSADREGCHAGAAAFFTAGCVLYESTHLPPPGSPMSM